MKFKIEKYDSGYYPFVENLNKFWKFEPLWIPIGFRNKVFGLGYPTYAAAEKQCEKYKRNYAIQKEKSRLQDAKELEL